MQVGEGMIQGVESVRCTVGIQHGSTQVTTDNMVAVTGCTYCMTIQKREFKRAYLMVLKKLIIEHFEDRCEEFHASGG